ncbi:MAG: cyclic nucleotide-binding domain-containing protein [Ketobacter sp.]|uniref:cyclic nucleotide-binding domain-containing protein n=1 Tax=Ketobacter sp. MCCC 1A13808 TaxID=2602738 RepID=UPI0018DBFAA8|nr:cyclic nucleotide-binding domain-containing protein [Ketobacter sp. MCCC 1A13808]
MSTDALAVDEGTIKNLIPFNELFRHQFQEALRCCEQISAPPRKKLFKRGDNDPFWYYLLKGSVNLIDEDFNSSTLNAEDEQCLHALDNQPPHRYSAITTSECLLLKVDKQRLDLAITWEQAGGYDVEDHDDDTDWMSALLDTDVFSKVPPANIQKLFATFKRNTANLGDVIIKEDQPGDRFYVIEHGSAVVSKRSGDRTDTLARLEAGQFFGEEALVGKTTRNATVTMETDGALMYLEEEEFKQLLEQPVLHHIKEHELETLRQSHPDMVMVDVRLSGEYKHFNRAGSVNIPLNKLRQRSAQMDKDTCYVVCHNAGPRSELGVYLLIKEGFQAYLLESAE